MSQGYTAPEALSSADPQATADIWSLGRLMYSLLGTPTPQLPSCGTALATNTLSPGSG